ncbi:PREDICTED: uncharacterized protein LOC106816679 [Priapulus caudatus]|uniref:Uncharacterized protein LOC106816679 n=1 Tax=Priapulus caudatus TaxID=37621 RepID=A0ABM1EX66_PRICU|nr:PREDICTED: uncharacterized protein LOC106816679 [Priapulus caudatus]
MIRDRIVVGLRDEKLAEKLQMDSKLTLVKAVDMTHQSESVKSQQTVIRNPSSRDPYRGDEEKPSSTSIVTRESTQSQQQRPGHSETHPQSRYSSRIVRPRYYRNLSDNQSDDSAVARENDPDDTASHDDDHSDGVRTRDETRLAGPPDTSARRYPKRSRLHMDAVTCMNDAAAGEGASALAAPHTRRTSSRDPHRGLCLLSPRSDCTALEVLECLYCVATFLLAFKDQLGINGGLHYRVFYALYLHENTMTVTRSDMASTLRRSNKGQQCISRYGMGTSCVRLTHEQLRIVNHQLAPGAVMKVVAFAGTGKTTTLLRYTQLRPHLSFLLVVYNKYVAMWLSSSRSDAQARI